MAGNAIERRGFMGASNEDPDTSALPSWVGDGCRSLVAEERVVSASWHALPRELGDRRPLKLDRNPIERDVPEGPDRRDVGDPC